MRGGWFLPAAAGLLSACGPVDVTQGPPGGTLCFDYFQQCVNPVFDATLPIYDQNGIVIGNNTCSASGCHQNPGSAGGSLKITPSALTVMVSGAMTDADKATVRATPMYGNFLSAKGGADLNTPRQSFLLKKPLVEVLHGGGRVFVNDQDPNARQFLFWITNRVPQGGDEFHAQCATLFATGGTCQVF